MPEKKEVPAVAPVNVEEKIDLSAQDIAKKTEIVSAIDVTKPEEVLSFGNEAQQQIASFSDEVLANVRTRDTGEVSDMLANLVSQLRSFDAGAERKKGFFGWFQSATSQMNSMKAKYDKVEINVTTITDALDQHKGQLIDDIGMLEKMYELNQNHFSALNVYIAAGEEKVKELRDIELPALLKKADETKEAADAQAARDFADQINRLEKKVHDLKLTRQVSIQMAPQVRLMQNNDSVLAEKIQSTLANTIPLWKSQMVIALGLTHADRALKAQQAVTDATNELLKKNAEALKQGTIQTAQAAERGVVDIDTIRTTNQSLIETLGEVQRIQAEGSAARIAAEAELVRLENDLKQKMLEFRDGAAATAPELPADA